MLIQMSNLMESFDAAMEWQEGDPPTDDESLEWIRSRPECIRQLMIDFPPSCLVMATRPLHIPAKGTAGVIVSYLEPDDQHSDGMLIVRQFPDGDTGANCRPEWLKAAGYYSGVTPEFIKSVLNG